MTATLRPTTDLHWTLSSSHQRSRRKSRSRSQPPPAPESTASTQRKHPSSRRGSRVNFGLVEGATGASLERRARVAPWRAVRAGPARAGPGGQPAAGPPRGRAPAAVAAEAGGARVGGPSWQGPEEGRAPRGARGEPQGAPWLTRGGPLRPPPLPTTTTCRLQRHSPLRAELATVRVLQTVNLMTTKWEDCKLF